MNKSLRLLLVTVTLAVAGVAAFCSVRAAETTTETITVAKVIRIWRIQIFTDFNTDPRIEVLHEQLRTVGSDLIGREQLPTTTRQLSAVATQEVTLANGRKITAAEIAEAIPLFDARWQGEDAAAAHPNP